MVGSVYCFRRSARTPQLIFWIEGDALWWSGDDEKQRLEFPDIREVRLTERYPQRRSALGGKRIWVAEFVGSRGAATVLSPLHFNRDGRWDDRSGDYYRFLNELLDRLKAANPNLAIVHRQHWYVRIGRAAARARAQLGGWALVGLVKACRPLPPDGLCGRGRCNRTSCGSIFTRSPARASEPRRVFSATLGRRDQAHYFRDVGESWPRLRGIRPP